MKVLLFANVGGSDTGFYHAGDEAMFYETYKLYKKYIPNSSITALSSYPSHKHLKIIELLNLRYPDKNNAARIFFLKLSIKAIIWKLTKKRLLHDEQFSFLQTICQQERIHFTGGGNITSLFIPWLYYSLTIIFLGWLFKKDVILTSQTIGPFFGIDRIPAFIILNLPRIIGLRRKVNSKYSLLKYGIIRPFIIGMMDAAYTLSTNSLYKLKNKNGYLRIGLSLHDWMDYGIKINKVIVDLIQKLNNQYKLEVILIPHLFTKNPCEWDRGFMENISSEFPKSVKVIKLNYSQLTKSSSEPAETIKNLSSCVDLLISSRYHGIVFALSKNVPCITFIFKKYYKIKNNGLLKIFYPNNINRYEIDVNCNLNFQENLRKVKEILSNLSEEKRYLKKINLEINDGKQNVLLKQIITKII